VEIDPKQYLPAEIEVEGFSNIAAALTVSPSFLEQYVNVARVVSHMAVGKPVPEVVKASFPPPTTGDQDGYVDGMPPGTRGGTKFAYTFPADGEYRVTITDLDFGLYPRGVENETTVVVLIDRKEVFRQMVGGDADRAFVDRGGGAPAGAKLMQRFANIPVQVTAGVHEVVVTFIERSRVATDDLVAGGSQYYGFAFKGYLRLPRLVGPIQIVGPHAATGPTRTPSREKLFICKPEALEQQVRLVLVVGRARDVGGGDEGGQPAFLAGASEHLDVEVGERQDGADFVLFAQLAQRLDVVRVVDERARGAHVRGVLRWCERRGVGGDRAGELREAGDDVKALADAGEQHGGGAHSSPSQPPAAPL
jgi:hypothetical protein